MSESAVWAGFAHRWSVCASTDALEVPIANGPATKRGAGVENHTLCVHVVALGPDGTAAAGTN